jgi:hypothetical protein
MKLNQKFEEILKRIETLKKDSGVDLSTDEDLAIGVMNLIGAEEHLFYTAEKTGKAEYLEALKAVREMRKDLLGKLISKHEGETWCTSKHLLSATMRLMEVGTKLQSAGKDTEAKEMFDKSYTIFNIFWAIRLNLLSLKEAEEITATGKSDDEAMSLNDIMKRLVDCCKE